MGQIFEQLDLPTSAPLNPKTVTDDRTGLDARQVYNGLVLYDTSTPSGVYVYTGLDGTNVETNWEAIGSGSLRVESGGNPRGNVDVETIDLVGPNTQVTQSGNTEEATFTVETAELITQAAFDVLVAGNLLVSGRYYEIDDVAADTDSIPADALPVIEIDKGGTGATTAADARTNLGINQDFEAPISATNQVDYITELANVPTEFTPSAHTHVLADVTDSGALAALNNVDYTGTIITNKPFTHATQAAFESAVDTRITTIGDVESYADMAAFTADITTIWHHGDVAIFLDTNIAYLYTGTEGMVSPDITNDFHQITSTETLVSLGITASAAELNQLMGITLGALAAQDNLTAEQISALNIPAASSIVLNEDPNTISDGTTTLRALPDAIVEDTIALTVLTPTAIFGELVGQPTVTLNGVQGIVADDFFEYLGTTYTISGIFFTTVAIAPALVDAIPQGTVLTIVRNALSFYIRDRDISIVNAANRGITIEPTDIAQSLAGTASVGSVTLAEAIVFGESTIVVEALGLTAVGDTFALNTVDNETVTAVDTATNTITFTPVTQVPQSIGHVLPVSRASNVITLINNTTIEVVGGVAGNTLFLDSDTRIPLADGYGPIGAINGGVYNAGTDVLEIIPESVQNFRDTTQHVRKWFGTQAQFDAETEITDGTVVYNIYPNA